MDKEERFKQELKESIYKDVGKFFAGNSYCLIIKNENDPAKTVAIPKHEIAEYIYREALKQVPWLQKNK